MKQYKIVICLVFLANMVNSQEIYSEAPIFIQNEHIMSDRFTIKFSENVIPTVGGEQIIPVNRISLNYTELIYLIQDIITTYGDIEIIKQLPNTYPGYIARINIITGESVTIMDLSQLFSIKFQQFVPIDSLMTLLSFLPFVEYVHQPVQIGHLESPNDDLYVNGDQWYLEAINAEQAWDITMGSSDIKIAIIDGDGVDFNHPDLTDKNSGGDGQYSGWGHGTKVAGVAAASTNNTIGIAGLGWELSLLGYQIDQDDESTIVQKISDAMEAGAHVINMSFATLGPEDGSSGPSCPIEFQSVSDIISNAFASGITIVASAGNGEYSPGCTNGGTIPYVQYPAAHPEVIAVTATDDDPLDNFREPWNYGDFVNISAPGENIWSTDPIGGYGYSSGRGTSYSAPLVSSLAGLIISMAPTKATPEIVYDIITATADKVGQYSYDSNGWNDHMGYGRINTYAALSLVESVPSAPTNFSVSGNEGENPVCS